MTPQVASAHPTGRIARRWPRRPRLPVRHSAELVLQRLAWRLDIRCSKLVHLAQGLCGSNEHVKRIDEVLCDVGWCMSISFYIYKI